MTSAFPRRDVKEHGNVNPLEFTRVLGAALHLLIPVATYAWTFQGHGVASLHAMGLESSEISPDRAAMLIALDVFYAVRWAFGWSTMASGGLTVLNTLTLAFIHLVFHCLVTDAVIMLSDLPAELGAIDYLGAGLTILAGVLQHGSELQRYIFKLDPKNKGKLHMGGLFSVARYINHTGHLLRDLAAALLAHAPLMVLFPFLPTAVPLLTRVVHETNAHLKKKYGAQFDEYCKRTPWMVLPGVF